MNRDFYVYVYSDPRNNVNSEYTSNGYLPFYVGKGSGDRLMFHISEYSLSHPSHKTHLIKQIISDGFTPCIEKYAENLTDAEALNLERDLIQKIGRRNLGTGSLTNLTDGGDGSAGYIATAETRLKISSSVKKALKTPSVIESRSRANTGKRNPRSRKVECEGICFYTVGDAMAFFNTTRHSLTRQPTFKWITQKVYARAPRDPRIKKLELRGICFSRLKDAIEFLKETRIKIISDPTFKYL